MRPFTFPDIVGLFLRQCAKAGINELDARARTLLRAFHDAGASSARLVSRPVEHDYLGTEGGEAIRSFDQEKKPRPMVLVGNHLIDPQLGVVDSAQVLELIHRDAFDRKHETDLYLKSTWQGPWRELIVDDEFIAPQLPGPHPSFFSRAEFQDDDREWEQRVAELAAQANLLGNINVGHTLAVLAGAAVHLVVNEHLPVATNRIVMVNQLAERSILVRRGVQVVSEVLDEPLFETMNLPVGRTETVHTWLDPWKMELTHGVEIIPMNSLQRWIGAGASEERKTAFQALTEMLAQRHHARFDLGPLPHKPRARM